MLLILTPSGINDYAFGTGLGNLAASFAQLPGTTVDWTKTAVSYHLYNNDAAYGAATKAQNLRNLHQRYAGWPSENSFPTGVTITDGDQWRSPSFDSDLYVNQTCEKLGIGWDMWFIDGETHFNANFPIMWADALAKGWTWVKDGVTPQSTTNIEANGNLKIYPNPASNQLFISNIKSLSEISILSIDGKIRYRQPPNNISTITIDIKMLKNGIYFVYVNEGKTTCKKKFAVLKSD
jgi:hypothetical protein